MNLMPIEDDGYIYIELQEFCSYADYYSQQDRLSFLIQQLGYELGLDFWCVSKKEWEENAQKLYESDKFIELSDKIAEYAGNGCKGVRLQDYSEGYIDHEGVYDSLDDFLDYEYTTLIDFVFGNNVIIHFEFNG